MGRKRLIKTARRKLAYLKGRLARLKLYMKKAPRDFAGAEVELYAVERLFTVVVQCAVDAAILTLLARGYEQPDAAKRAFSELATQGILHPDFGARLTERVRERNRLVHLYDQMTPGEVYAAAQAALMDFPLYIERIYIALAEIEQELQEES